MEALFSPCRGRAKRGSVAAMVRVMDPVLTPGPMVGMLLRALVAVPVHHASSLIIRWNQLAAGTGRVHMQAGRRPYPPFLYPF